jgi:nucleotide-binding universal stress UspA family protein
VTLLTVIEPVPWIPPVTNMPFAFAPAIYDENITRELISAAEQDLAQVKATLERAALVVDTSVVVASSATHAIMDCMASRMIDVVAMSTHGRGASRLLVGSVADKVLRSSNVPVLLYHPGAKPFDDGRVEETAADDKPSLHQEVEA